MHKTIRVVVVEHDNLVPYVKIISNDLSKLQAIVGGYIELVRYRGFYLICNEEGKIIGLPYNRPLWNEDEIYEIIAGDFVVSVSDEEGNLRDMTDEEVRSAIELFTWTQGEYGKWIKRLKALGVKVVGE
ncbi:hypothetical protein SECTIM467_165 [Brevibacillus phage SecTim467]|uniref:DUF3846 domain-containing protein n=2 Tax=Jenstvirus jenst TaxID=1982225 RepID=A0A0K2CP36_9CAUD|nr:hypothetical protein AVV11_gp031 [Brevibacillus phage Jenst]ALA07289.1 hypothetical protein JENST_160 [Brevibacillus phage Jenst]ALA07488.1 hypothetical protein SECTIM467_165 [Brevibacillus phage SecTim467]